jgi:tRNA threonylcarbamoyladenosine biosynthesis protein TsaE
MSVSPEQEQEQEQEQESQASSSVTLERSGECILLSVGASETQRLGIQLGELLAPGDVVLLEGDLGAGKTAFTQGIGRGLKVMETINSPTFTILKEYSGRLPLHHFDLYRIDHPEEFFMLGFEDYFGGEGICVVEWAERAEAAGTEELPVTTPQMYSPWPEGGYLRVRLSRDRAEENARSLRCTSRGERGRVLLAAFASVTALNGVE